MPSFPPFVEEPPRRIALLGEYDVVVLGGGPAGIAASVSASRRGMRTFLAEHYGFLGGMGTAAGVTNFCGLHANVRGEMRRVVHGVASDLLDRIAHLGGLNEPHAVLGKTLAQAYDMPAYKCAADELLAAAGVEILFHAHGVQVVKEDERRIAALVLETKGGRRAVRARCFIDCSGDGDLAALAGARTEKGDGAGHMLYPTLMFRVNGVDPERAREAPQAIPRLMEEARASGEFSFPRKSVIVRPQKNPVEWRVNVTQLANPDGSPVDGTDAAQLSRAEREGRRQVVDYFRFLKSRVPGFERAYIVDIAPQLGIRETRRVTCDYMVSGEDVIGCRDFDDTIGVNGWPLEIHVAGDVKWIWPAIPESRGFNQLPFRMIRPVGLDNLLVAGRCAGMTHEGQSAARVSGPCFVMGQAAGTAAALALASGKIPRDIDIAALQRALQSDGVWLAR
ncbi:MAG TPA: FAD-dependent oxidoreductase [Usitatibacter sp.]|nr:FAD-dependent oxidoreductase [Usitatibacter sp.]